MRTSIQQLKIEHFRNLQSIDLTFANQFNVFKGANGAGKTSLLEAIYYLSTGHSFRTHLIPRIVQHDQPHLSIFAALSHKERIIPLGVQRHRDGEKQMKIDGEHAKTHGDLAKWLPVQLISNFSYRLFIDGPKLRRQFLDWLVFHVKHSFFELWQNSQRLLKQRNAALKQGLPYREIAAWDQELDKTSQELDALREKTVIELDPFFQSLLSQLDIKPNLKLRYYRGWKKDASLSETLQQQFQRDLELGYTQSGPHRADLAVYHGQTPAQDALSQGQQKVVLYALHLAQGLLYQEHHHQGPIYLIDDLPSELDPEKRSKVTKILQAINSQVFITGITEEDLQDILALDSIELFHVEHGVISASD